MLNITWGDKKTDMWENKKTGVRNIIEDIINHNITHTENKHTHAHAMSQR